MAIRRHGNITHAQLIELGLTRSAIARRVSNGRLYRVHPGVYAVGRPPTTPLERASAAALACGPGASLSHASAMTLWGFWTRWDTPFEVTVIRDRRPNGITVHRPSTLHRHDIRIQLGIRTTSPARTLFDITPRPTANSPEPSNRPSSRPTSPSTSSLTCSPDFPTTPRPTASLRSPQSPQTNTAPCSRSSSRPSAHAGISPNHR
jgi:hypothetical protein